MTITTDIRGGIEWYQGRDEGDWDCQCARCGSSCSHLDCLECGGDGFVEEDYGDDACEDLRDVRCPECRGDGGSWHCLSSPEWCSAHPLPGREAIESTALNSQAWHDSF